MKSRDGKLRFGFLTGVTKLGKLSIFSGLNNLKDISMDHRYADICGISENDLHAYFDGSVQEMADANEISTTPNSKTITMDTIFQPNARIFTTLSVC